MHEHLESVYNDGKNYVLHYVTAREMYNIVKAAEAGKSGDPHATAISNCRHRRIATVAKRRVD
jgi:hypothetical protein